MNVSEFGYDGKYYITDDNIINNVSLDNVINLGDRNYFTKKNDVLYSVETNQPIQVNKDVLYEWSNVDYIWYLRG